MKLRIKNMIAVTVLMCIILVAGCQPTPEKEAVVGKRTDGGLTIGDQGGYSQDGISSWKDTIIYKNGTRVVIDAEIPLVDTEKVMDSVAVSPVLFSDTNVQSIIEAIFPVESLYARGSGFSKEEIETDILRYKQYIFEEQNSGNVTADENIEFWLNTIQDLESQYDAAPSIKEFSLHYNFHQEDQKKYLQLVSVMDHATYDISIADYPEGDGSRIYITSSTKSLRDGLYSEVSDLSNAEAGAAMELANKILADTGIANLSLHAVYAKECYDANNSKEESKGYSVVYTRNINQISEQYAPDHTGTSSMTMENGKFRFVWEAEYLRIDVHENELVKFDWRNPSEVSLEAGSLAQLLPWETIADRFNTVMRQTLAAEVFDTNRKYTVNPIKFGYTKVMVPNSKEYHLVPTWNFYGNIEWMLNGKPELLNDNMCFAVINALNGASIDLGLGY